ncbi:MAG: hypothetical protein GY800_01025 [Planctomycetes bacterium]|nr:hypothetical protein [Planctomycetota bacterium]
MKKHSISYGGHLPTTESGTPYACKFIIKQKDSPGKEFYFKIYLGRSSCAKLGIKKDFEYFLLKYGLEETERRLRSGIDKDDRIDLILGVLPSCPEVLQGEKDGLQEFIDGKPKEL